MRNSLAKWVAGAAALVVAGAVVYTVGQSAPSEQRAVGQSLGSARPPTSTPMMFFSQLQGPTVDIALKPDAFVQKNLAGDNPPTANISVRVPVYPGATQTTRVKGIDDMGIPMTSALVDGAVYFQSTDSETQIQAWYTRAFKQLSYSVSGSGSAGGRGVTTSRSVAFTKDGSPGEPTQSPEIDLGMISSGGHTVFKLFVKYVVMPSRSSGTYLPNDIVKVVLTDGKVTKTETDSQWIQRAVADINTLAIDPPGARSCPAMAADVRPIQAKFYEQSGRVIPVVFTLPCGVRDVIVGGSKSALAGNAALDKLVEQFFPLTPLGQ